MPVFCAGGVVEAAMEFRLLGPLEVAEGSRLIPLGGSRPSALLALLLLRRNEVVALDRIVDELWAGQPPKTAEQVVRVYVSNLRKALEPGGGDEPPRILVTHGSGYVLRVAPGDVDVDRFEELRADARRLLAQGDAAEAAKVLGEALSLWRGPALQDFAYETFAQPEIARLAELRLATLEDRFDARLAAGEGSELVADLEQLVDASPLRERPRAQLMLALYRSGRQADALETYHRGRRLLADELGLEPGEPLRRLELRILQQDPELVRPTPATFAAEGTGPPPQRRRWLSPPGIAVAATLVAAIAAVLIAATTGPAQRRSGAAALRVTFVPNTAPDLTDQSAGVVEPVNALREAANELGIVARVRYGGDSLSRFLRTLAVAARTSGLVFAGPTTVHAETLFGLTRRFPKTRFLVDGSLYDPTGQPNVTGLVFDGWEDGYLGGYLAALVAHHNDAISAVGGLPVPSVRDLIRGFRAGARRARPGIRVLVDYAGTFKYQDQGPCERAANRQIDEGSAVVFDVAGGCGFGALEAADVRGVWGLGVDDDLSYLNSQILASVVKKLSPATELAVRLFASGRLPGGRDLRLGLASDSIGLAGINGRVPPTVRAKVEAVEAKLRARDQARNSR